MLDYDDVLVGCGFVVGDMIELLYDVLNWLFVLLDDLYVIVVFGLYIEWEIYYWLLMSD